MTIDTTAQPTKATGAVTIYNNPVSYGTSISHSTGSENIIINSSGIYMAAFTGIFNLAKSNPDSIIIYMYLNGTLIPGAVASHSFSTKSDIATIPMYVLFKVTTVPSTLQVITGKSGFILTSPALSIVKLSSSI